MESLGFSRSGVHRFLSGERSDIRLKTVSAICGILDISVEQFIGETPLDFDPEISKVYYQLTEASDADKLVALRLITSFVRHRKQQSRQTSE